MRGEHLDGDREAIDSRPMRDMRPVKLLGHNVQGYERWTPGLGVAVRGKHKMGASLEQDAAGCQIDPVLGGGLHSPLALC